MADSIIREIYDEHFGAKIQLKRRASGRGTYLAVSTDSPDYSIPQLLSCFQRPLSYHVRVTKKCNLSCPYCYAEDQTNTEDMSDAQVWELISRANREGAMLFSWTGGEPLLRTGIIDCIEEVHQYGIHQTLLTNGTKLDENTLNRLPKSIFTLQVGFNEPWAIDSAAKEMHSLVLYNIKTAIKEGFPVCVSITFDPLHIEMLPYLLQTFESADITNVKVGLLLPIGRLADLNYSDYAKDVINVANRLREIRKEVSNMYIEFQYDCCQYSALNPIPKRFLQCEAGVSQIYIDNNGDVYPCPLFKSHREMNCGNYFLQPISELWNSYPMRRLRNAREAPCEKCGTLCGVWCRALQYQLTGDVLGASVICPIKRGMEST